MENAKIQKFKCDIVGDFRDFQTLCKGLRFIGIATDYSNKNSSPCPFTVLHTFGILTIARGTRERVILSTVLLYKDYCTWFYIGRNIVHV